MSASTALRPCPFCGDQDPMLPDDDQAVGDDVRVSCGCVCFGPPGASLAGAAAGWNRRVINAASGPLPACPFCGGTPRVVEVGDKNATPGDPFAEHPYSCFVACERCQANGPIGGTRADAEADWRRRRGTDQEERSCTEVLVCPSCEADVVQFSLLAYRLVRCSGCRGTVRVTRLEAILGGPGDLHDVVKLHGVVE